MLKPDWKDAPEWANWLAMDRNGAWWWHEKEPKIHNKAIWASSGRLEEPISTPSWEKTLEERPNGK